MASFHHPHFLSSLNKEEPKDYLKEVAQRHGAKWGPKSTCIGVKNQDERMGGKLQLHMTGDVLTRDNWPYKTAIWLRFFCVVFAWGISSSKCWSTVQLRVYMYLLRTTSSPADKISGRF